LAIRFGNSVWQFGLAIRFDSVWQNEFNLTIRQFSLAKQIRFDNSVWQFDLAFLCECLSW
jgi:hypothetical protein